MRRAAALVAFFLAAACSREVVLPARPDENALRLEADAQSYRAGEPLRLTLSGRSADPAAATVVVAGQLAPVLRV